MNKIYLFINYPKYFIKNMVCITKWDAYFIALVKSIEDKEIGKDHVNDGAKFSIINAESIKIIINKPGTKALNRGIFAFLESLVDYSRIEIIDGEKREDLDFDQSIRPQSLSEYVGQTDIKENLKVFIKACGDFAAVW